MPTSDLMIMLDLAPNKNKIWNIQNGPLLRIYVKYSVWSPPEVVWLLYIVEFDLVLQVWKFLEEWVDDYNDCTLSIVPTSTYTIHIWESLGIWSSYLYIRLWFWRQYKAREHPLAKRVCLLWTKKNFNDIILDKCIEVHHQLCYI